MTSASIMDVAAQLRAAIQDHPMTVVLDGSGVRRLGSIAIGTLASLQSDINGYGGRLVFKAFSQPARTPFEICRVTEHFNWDDIL